MPTMCGGASSWAGARCDDDRIQRDELGPYNQLAQAAQGQAKTDCRSASSPDRFQQESKRYSGQRR